MNNYNKIMSGVISNRRRDWIPWIKFQVFLGDDDEVGSGY